MNGQWGHVGVPGAGQKWFVGHISSSRQDALRAIDVYTVTVSPISMAAVKCQDQEQLKEGKIDFGSAFRSAGVLDGWEGMAAEGQCKTLAYHTTTAYRKQRG